MRLSVVIPVLNEAARLPGLLAGLRAEAAQVIVVDGGSIDGSASLARAAGVTVLESSPGRARQMNAGARVAGGEVLLFLHADTVLPAGAARLVRAALADGRHMWGRFDVVIDGKPAMLRVIAALMNLRSRLTGIATGDQAMFVTRAAFEAAGGFPEQPLMEDIELSSRLLRQSRPACLRPPVRTSGRRWESRGVWRTIALMWRLRWDYWRGVPAAELAERYR
ncbi:MAG: TIGR04283 family arsenosugar biosynthesis glycosyltransferase [Zoogloeaceae bacterium]|nr:TIGR04283 family arsenosugar biosynthesis glycosyltransferase [Zoogloeaceae bacterium]